MTIKHNTVMKKASRKTGRTFEYVIRRTSVIVRAFLIHLENLIFFQIKSTRIIAVLFSTK